MSRSDDVKARHDELAAYEQARGEEVGPILAKLNNLTLDAPENEEKTIDDLRRKLDEIMAREPAEEDQAQYANVPLADQPLERRYHTAIFNIQLLLAKHWCRNNKNDQGQPIDPFSLEDFDISDEDVVILSNGYLFKRQSLNDYFANGDAFRVNGRVVDAVNRQPYTNRELESIKNQQVQIPIPNRRFLDFIGLGRFDLNFAIAIFSVLGAAAGVVFGISIGVVINGIIGFLCPPISLVGWSILIGTAGIVGGVHASRGNNFFIGMLVALGGSIIAMSLLAMIMTPILVAVVPALSLPAAIAGFAFALPFLPSILMLAGGVAEVFSPGKMYEIFEGILLAPIVISGFVFGAIGAGIGALVAVCRGRPVQEEAVNLNDLIHEDQARLDNAPRDGLRDHAHIMRALHIHHDHDVLRANPHAQAEADMEAVMGALRDPANDVEHNLHAQEDFEDALDDIDEELEDHYHPFSPF